MFDPEKVERVTANACFPNDPDGEGKWWDYVVVKEEDFDQLLSDYKEAIAQIRTLIKERDALVPKSSETDPAPQASA